MYILRNHICISIIRSSITYRSSHQRMLFVCWGWISKLTDISHEPHGPHAWALWALWAPWGLMGPSPAKQTLIYIYIYICIYLL